MDQFTPPPPTQFYSLKKAKKKPYNLHINVIKFREITFFPPFAMLVAKKEKKEIISHTNIKNTLILINFIMLCKVQMGQEKIKHLNHHFPFGNKRLKNTFMPALFKRKG